MINLLRAPMEKVDNLQEQMHNINRDRNSKKESKRNARDQQHCNRNHNAFYGLMC